MKRIRPKNWPEKFIYSSESVGIEIHIAMLRLALFSNRPEDRHKITSCIEEKRAHPHIEIRKITPRLSYKGPKPHPLANLKGSEGHDQYGVFAKKKIHKHAALGEYVGEVCLLSYSSAEEKKDACFNWIVNWKNLGFLCIDSRKIANELAYVNDYRGLNDAPNAYLAWMINRGFYYLGYAALRNIEQNEEILIDYGNEWANFYHQNFIPKEPENESQKSINENCAGRCVYQTRRDRICTFGHRLQSCCRPTLHHSRAAAGRSP